MSAASKLAPGVSQRLRLAPALADSLRLLALPGIELDSAVEAALETNVMLEWGNAEMPEAPLAAEGRRAASDSGETLWEAAQPEDLHAHLAAQLALEHLPARDFAIAQVIVDALDEDGYLRAAPEALAETLEPLDPPAAEDEIEAILHRVQRLEPTGVAARDSRECLLLQLGERAPETPGLACAKALVRHHLDALGHHDIIALARLAGCSREETQVALAMIHGLDPHPGRRYASARIEYLIPELIARRTGTGWRIEANPTLSPRLSVNEGYASWLTAHCGEASVQPLVVQLDEARMLISSLARREATLLRIGRALAARQAAFLERGPAALLPFTLRELAAALDLHESTVSRAVQGKSIACPRGVIPLRHFFSASLSQNAADEALASGAVRARIGELIAAENPAAPLSDAALVAALAAGGIRIARRTVTKYREALGLASTRERGRPGSKPSKSARAPSHPAKATSFESVRRSP
jgi:RNA polymerase sigma-54 factor